MLLNSVCCCHYCRTANHFGSFRLRARLGSQEPPLRAFLSDTDQHQNTGGKKYLVYVNFSKTYPERGIDTNSEVAATDTLHEKIIC